MSAPGTVSTTERHGRGVRAALLAPLALMLAACVATPEGLPDLARAEAPRFDPFTFFVGESRGEGTLDKVLADPVPVRVSSVGRIETLRPRESAWAAPETRVLVLDQVVSEGDKKPRKRQWRLVETAPGRYEGTLTDAIGPVSGRAEGNLLTLEYRIEGGFQVRQELTLSPDGSRAANVLEVSQLGVTIAALAEEIVGG
ncbi:MAG: DUF3833 family protein [Porphyrobacter sp.]|nr:DUF3833 family protein [Porphyrobacter sp.]